MSNGEWMSVQIPVQIPTPNAFLAQSPEIR